MVTLVEAGTLAHRRMARTPSEPPGDPNDVARLGIARHLLDRGVQHRADHNPEAKTRIFISCYDKSVRMGAVMRSRRADRHSQEVCRAR
jgi:hypothetical protein